MIASKGLLLIVVTWSRPVGRMLRLSDLPIGSIDQWTRIRLDKDTRRLTLADSTYLLHASSSQVVKYPT